ncbi:hypothetical protein PSI23_16070 [Xenorhabdus sp. XENO-10]|uniref:Uncharacterized protein n=1 Tax=Xenorhabdus yunnanensis TaxID=3025878 RepID=A0ABT5LLX1_9GAMM|nr:hypothetical protein [Xenorhabdus yunnanensis]MDC9590760.1 hypothetical protein [Xenorhabdus yunnanensis]
MVNTALKLQEQERIINAIEKASNAELSALADIRNLLSKNNKINADDDGLIINRPSRIPQISKKTQHNTLGLKLIEAKKIPQENSRQINDIHNTNDQQMNDIHHSNEHQTVGKPKRKANIKQINDTHNTNDRQTNDIHHSNDEQITKKKEWHRQNSKFSLI